MSNPCQHEQFDCEVNIIRLEEPGGKLGGLMAEVRITCHECRQEAQFVGCPMGLMPDRPTVSPEGIELRVPIVLDGTAHPLRVPGFLVHQRAA